MEFNIMNKTIYKIGFLVRTIAFITTTAYVIVQLLQLARVFIFPVNEVLIYGTSLCIVIPFVFEILALHYVTADAKTIVYFYPEFSEKVLVLGFPWGITAPLAMCSLQLCSKGITV